MRLTARVGIVLAVIAIAIAAALPFRKSAHAPQPNPNAVEHTVERRMHRGGPEGWSRQMQSTPLRTQALQLPTVATGMDPESSTSIPSMPPSYHRTFSPVGALLNPREDLDEQVDANTSEPQLLDPGFVDAPSQALTHKIEDGDTLANLAARYLEDADRWRDLYEANRDILKSPDLLPIGRILQIPSRDRTARPNPSEQPAPALAPIPRGAFHRD